MTVLSVVAEILLVGHSLIGPDLPPLLEAAFRASGSTVQVQAQIINGAPLKYQWENSANAEGVDARATLAAGKTDVLVLTEAIPLAGQIEWNDSAAQTALFAGLAWEKNPETRVYIYETWHSLASGPGVTIKDDPGAGVLWRARLTADLPLWESLAAQANAARPEGSAPIRLIPAGQAMALAADAIDAGNIPEVTKIRDLFDDDIHPNGKGRYLVAMVHLAAITGKSPEGLPAKLTRQWQNRDAILTDAQARALQSIAWQAVQAQTAREAAASPFSPPPPAPVAAPPAPEPVAQPVATDAAIATLTNVTNRNLGLGLTGVNDWSVQQPFLDVMKTARPWTGHLAGQWGGWDHDKLAAAGHLDSNGWLKSFPAGVTGVSTLILTDLPDDAGGVAGRYLLRHKGAGDLKVEGRAQNVQRGPAGLTFDYTPGEGAVILTLSALDPADPLRDITVVREDHLAAFDAGEMFNPNWLARIKGVKLIRFMDWMMTNDSPVAQIADSPKPADYTWARVGVPMETMIALANELHADPWFNMPHLASDDLVRLYAKGVRDTLAPDLHAYVEYSNETWNGQFAQARWAEDQARNRWSQDGAGPQFAARRAAEVMDLWHATYGAAAKARLIRVIATQTGIPGMETALLDAPLVVAEGRNPPAQSFDAYAVAGYFSSLLGSEEKSALVREWLAASMEATGTAADDLGLTGPTRDTYFKTHRYDLAIANAAKELSDGRLSGQPENALADVLNRIMPYQADVAKKHNLALVMYEGGSHVTATGPLVDDAELAAFFEALNYSPEMGALYDQLLIGWARVSDAPFNAFVDVYRPTKWGSWGALRHLGDDNPRWQALAKGCETC